MAVIWAPIEGFEDYAVSNEGKVRNVRYDRYLRPRTDSYGYHKVALHKRGEVYECYIHRLVAKAFMTAYHDDVQMAWADDDRGNNHVTNLRFKGPRGVGQYRKVHPPMVHQRILCRDTGQVFRTAYDAAAFFNGDASSIYKVLTGQRLKHKGLSFEYIESEVY